ncbi:hypothetical protein [Bifidobacterium merycicum]|uniref:hypothetical protein n=1 Tax=Bifidobacterium merycicum TaxID=78345 RepID=UPI0023F558F3|nr:hypothetical protein [Bifidobacterium merycicum]
MTQANSTALRDTSWQQLVNVAYWRLFVNAALTVCDMAAFVLASVIVLMARNEASRRTFITLSKNTDATGFSSPRAKLQRMNRPYPS